MTTNASPRNDYEYLCPECGTVVGRRTTREGVPYVATLSAAYDNGRRYSRGAHRDICATVKARRDEQRSADAALLARAEAGRRRMVAYHRWMDVYGDDFRAWQAVDPEAANAHLEALLRRVV